MGRAMVRRRLLVWVTVALALLLVLPGLAAASTGDPESTESSGAAEREDEDDEWDDFEEDDEVSLAAASSKAVGRAVKALPQLNDQNADRILTSTEYVLLLGYASWCKQSAAVMIDFADAATVLAAKGSPVVLAKLDAIANKVTANRFKIQGYPTIVFLTNGSGELYTAGQTRDDFVTWVQKRTGRPGTTFTTEAEARELQSRDITVVIGLFEKFEGPEYAEFIEASLEAVDVEFLQTTNVEAAKVFSADFGDTAPAIAIWKSEPERFIRFGGQLNRAEIVAFVALNKYALVTKLYARNAAKIYASPVKKQVLLFANSYDYDSIYSFYLAAARYFKGELVFLWVDIEDEEFAKPMTTMFGILGSEPAVAGFDNTNGSRYLMEAEVNRQHLKAFFINFKEGRLKVHYKSEPVPKKNKGDVKVVVGKTFEKLVLKNSKDVLLMVYTSYCRDCENLQKVLVRLAKHFKGVSSIMFAKVLATANEHPQLQVQNYPAFLLYRAGSKSPPVEGPGNPNFKKLVQFVEESHISLLSTKQDPEGEIQSILTEAEVLQETDIRSEPTVTSLEMPKVIDTESEDGTAPTIEEPHLSENLHVSSNGEQDSTAEVLNTRIPLITDEIVRAGAIESKSTFTEVELPEGRKIETKSETGPSADEVLQDFPASEPSNYHDEF